MSERIQKKAQHTNKQQTTEETTPSEQKLSAKERADKLKEEIDSILDEIDDLLAEEDAAEFVRSYVQKGGQ